MSFEVVTRILFAGLGLFVTACTEPQEPCDVSEFEQCHKDQALDSTGISNALVSKWKWEYLQVCYGSDGRKNSDNYAGHSVEFLADGTFILYRPNSTSYFHWALDSLPYDGWKIVDPTRPQFTPHPSVAGRIRLCGDRLLANEGYLDGADNFFVRE